MGRPPRLPCRGEGSARPSPAAAFCREEQGWALRPTPGEQQFHPPNRRACSPPAAFLPPAPRAVSPRPRARCLPELGGCCSTRKYFQSTSWSSASLPGPLAVLPGPQCGELRCRGPGRGSQHVAAVPVRTPAAGLFTGPRRRCATAPGISRGLSASGAQRSGHRATLGLGCSAGACAFIVLTRCGMIKGAECEMEAGSPALGLGGRHVPERCAPTRAPLQGLCAAACPARRSPPPAVTELPEVDR